MKNINIISEAIYKGKHKLVNQGAFINISDLMSDIFSCFGITCCNGLIKSESDYFIRRAYLRQGRKKPGANWTSLNKIVLEIYNCFSGTTYCPGNLSEQWWITTDVIRPKKTIETINFTPIIEKVLNCCGIINTCINLNLKLYSSNWTLAGITSKSDFETLLANMGNGAPIVSNFVKEGAYLGASISNAQILDFTLLSNPNLYAITNLPTETSYLDISSQAFTTSYLDVAGNLFLQGTLPKSTWNSTNQQTTDQPSAGVQANLTANVNTVTF